VNNRASGRRIVWRRDFSARRIVLVTLSILLLVAAATSGPAWSRPAGSAVIAAETTKAPKLRKAATSFARASKTRSGKRRAKRRRWPCSRLRQSPNSRWASPLKKARTRSSKQLPQVLLRRRSSGKPRPTPAKPGRRSPEW